MLIMSGTVLTGLYALSHLIFMITLRGIYYDHFHLIDNEAIRFKL